MAQGTVAIVARGTYQSAAGLVNITQTVQECLDSTRWNQPEELNALRRRSLASSDGHGSTHIEVVNETTLAGIARVIEEGAGTVTALNFASAKNPGGGFLNGAQAQEETLARSSALHASLGRAGEFYDQHRQSPSLLYSDAMIVSPRCPIFRDDDGRLLDNPHAATFLTSPAPNAGAIASKRSAEQQQITAVLYRRAESILALAAAHGARTLILGAWGCGVFRNDPTVVAAAFANPLRSGIWSGRFDRVVFSVLDNSAAQTTFLAFEEAFA